MSPVLPLVLGLQLLLSQTETVGGNRAVRGSVALPVSSRAFAEALGFGSPEPSTLLLRVAHLAYERSEAEGRRTRDSLERLLAHPVAGAEVAPLPLAEDLWRNTILSDPTTQGDLVTAILRDRPAALLYIGLSALDDETLTWLASHRDVLLHLRKFPQLFAAFGRSVHVRGGRVVVPGNEEGEPLWTTIVGADSARPEVFIEHLIGGDGRLAFLFDTVAHLDPLHQRFALGLHLGRATRETRFRALLAAFAAAAPEWRMAERLFPKPPIDGALLLSTLRVLPNGAAAPPIARRLWDRIFRADELNDVPFQSVSETDATMMSAALNVDAAWLADHILRVPYAVGRRRLDTFLFAQRVFGAQPASAPGSVATALRGYLSFPALMMSLERDGLIDPALFVCAAQHAARLTAIESPAVRKSSVTQFQSAVALIERIHRSGLLDTARASSLIRSACSLELSLRTGYDFRFAGWLGDVFLKMLPSRNTSEETMLAAVAGVRDSPPLPIVSWEGRQYRIDPAAAELERLKRVRARQGVQLLDAALSVQAVATEDNRAAGGDQALADTLVSMVYAVHLGDPAGSAVTSGNVALRHDFGFAMLPSRGAGDAWRLPLEHFDGKSAWRVRGAVLGLEAALGRLSLRRLDPSAMPGEPRIGAQDRQTLMLTMALMNPFALSDDARDEIADAIAAGRMRVAALSQDRSQQESVAHDAGMSEWRRHALAWALTDHRDVAPLFSLVELFWLGAHSSEGRPIDEWGAAGPALTGCFCLTMPERGAWEDLRGYSPAVLASRGADISLRIAEILAALKLPAALAPGLAGFVTQDVFDHAELAHPDDWEEFGRAVQALPRERMFDYIAALAVGGPLVPTETEK